MFTLTSLTWCSSAIRSSTGATAWHGPHHSAQKSTTTLPSVFRTSLSNVSLVALIAISSFLSVFVPVNDGPRAFLPGRYSHNHVLAAAGQARSSRSGTGDSGRLGARAHLRAAPRAERRRAEVVVHRRPCDGEQGPRDPHGLGPHAEGCLPALQGSARVR